MKENGNYNNNYSKESLFSKIKSDFSKAGVSVAYGTLLIFYDPNVPIKAKATIISVLLGYFISTIDLITDPIPVAGHGDDLTAIITVLGVIPVFITLEIKRKLRRKQKSGLVM